MRRDDAWVEASLLLITSDLRSDLGSTTRSRAISRYISLLGMTRAAFRRSSKNLALPLPSNLLPPAPPLQSELSVHESARQRLRGEWDALQGIGGGGGCGVGRRFIVFRFGSNIVSGIPYPWTLQGRNQTLSTRGADYMVNLKSQIAIAQTRARNPRLSFNQELMP